MVTEQESIKLLQDPVAQELLKSAVPAQLAYDGLDGKPRVVPMWFEWDGEHIILGSPAGAPKIEALRRHPEVALSIDSDAWPYKVLQIRGTATVEDLDDTGAEYAASAKRYFGPDQGPAWIEQLHKMGKQQMARITIRPHWVGILDFVKRFPSALS